MQSGDLIDLIDSFGKQYTFKLGEEYPYGSTPESLNGDNVNHPKHYNSHPSGIECITITRWFNFNLGNVIKYLWRAPFKELEIEDLEKARWYLDDEIKRMKNAKGTL